MDGQIYSFVGVDPIVFTDDRKIILARRGSDAGAEVGKWHIPGALVKVGETLDVALQRAVLEKTNVQIEPFYAPLAKSFVAMYDGLDREPRYRDIALSFLCRYIGGNMHPGARMAEVRAFDVSELDRLDIGFDHRKILSDAVEFQRVRGYFGYYLS